MHRGEKIVGNVKVYQFRVAHSNFKYYIAILDIKSLNISIVANKYLVAKKNILNRDMRSRGRLGSEQGDSS